jgi:hypothetical protein
MAVVVVGVAQLGAAHKVAQVDADPATVAAFGADYSDAFSVAAAAGTTAADWARQSLRGADAANGVFRQGVWHGVLGFDLASPETPDTFVGWRISEDRPERFVLDADGRLMRGRMVFDVSPSVVTWTTMLAFHRPAGARVWSVAAYIHRALVRRLLGRAATSLERAPSNSRGL